LIDEVSTHGERGRLAGQRIRTSVIPQCDRLEWVGTASSSGAEAVTWKARTALREPYGRSTRTAAIRVPDTKSWGTFSRQQVLVLAPNGTDVSTFEAMTADYRVMRVLHLRAVRCGGTSPTPVPKPGTSNTCGRERSDQSVVGAVAIGAKLPLNHKPGRYLGV
jgi:hypothetical protein